MFTVSDAWKAAYPDACIGVLAMEGVANPEHHEGLAGKKAALEEALRAEYGAFDRAAIKALPRIAAYNAYYRQFKKTYHVQLQLESVVNKGRSIPSVAALVEAMFMAELGDQLLTAGHDLDLVAGTAGVDVASGDEVYVGMGGREQVCKAGDMIICDGEGVLSSIVYGPDQRTRITEATTRALFTVYAPSGIDEAAVRQHLSGIQQNALLIAPGARTMELAVYR